MKGIILMELKKEKEKLFFKMEIFMMGILIMVYLMDMENFIKMENGEMFYLKMTIPPSAGTMSTQGGIV